MTKGLGSSRSLLVDRCHHPNLNADQISRSNMAATPFSAKLNCSEQTLRRSI